MYEEISAEINGEKINLNRQDIINYIDHAKLNTDNMMGFDVDNHTIDFEMIGGRRKAMCLMVEVQLKFDFEDVASFVRKEKDNV